MPAYQADLQRKAEVFDRDGRIDREVDMVLHICRILAIDCSMWANLDSLVVLAYFQESPLLRRRKRKVYYALTRTRIGSFFHLSDAALRSEWQVIVYFSNLCSPLFTFLSFWRHFYFSTIFTLSAVRSLLLFYFYPLSTLNFLRLNSSNLQGSMIIAVGATSKEPMLSDTRVLYRDSWIAWCIY